MVKVRGRDIATPLHSKDLNIDIGDLIQKLRFGNINGSLVISQDGSIRLINDAASWDDIRVPIERTRKIASKEAVDVVYKGGIVSAFESSKEEGVAFNVQLPHKWKEGSDIFFHIHYVLPVNVASGSAENIKWKFTYSWANINEAFPTETTLEETIDVQGGVIDVSKIAPFPALDGSGKKLSSQLICSLVRDITVADNYAGDVYVVEVDFHYQVDGFGSEDVFIKDVITI